MRRLGERRGKRRGMGEKEWCEGREEDGIM